MTDKLPPLKPSDHPEPRIMQWSKLEMEFIQAYARQAVRDYKADLLSRMNAEGRVVTEAEGDAFTDGYFCGVGEAALKEREGVPERGPIFFMAIDTLNKVKAWRDCEGNAGFPQEVREQIDAVLMAFETRPAAAAAQEAKP